MSEENNVQPCQAKGDGSAFFELLIFLRDCREDILREHGWSYLKTYMDLRGINLDKYEASLGADVIASCSGLWDFIDHFQLGGRLEWCRCPSCEQRESDLYEALLQYIEELPCGCIEECDC